MKINDTCGCAYKPHLIKTELVRNSFKKIPHQQWQSSAGLRDVIVMAANEIHDGRHQHGRHDDRHQHGRHGIINMAAVLMAADMMSRLS